MLIFTHSALPELEASNYGLSGTETVSTDGLIYSSTSGQSSVAEITGYLKKVYCNTMAIDISAVEVRSRYHLPSLWQIDIHLLEGSIAG